MKTVTLTAEEIRMLGIQLSANPCEARCAIGQSPHLPKLDNGTLNCNALNKDGEYICPLRRAIYSIEKKLNLI